MCEHSEFIAVVSVETILSPEPDESLIVLYDLSNLSLRQALRWRAARTGYRCSQWREFVQTACYRRVPLGSRCSRRMTLQTKHSLGMRERRHSSSRKVLATAILVARLHANSPGRAFSDSVPQPSDHCFSGCQYPRNKSMGREIVEMLVHSRPLLQSCYLTSNFHTVSWTER